MRKPIHSTWQIGLFFLIGLLIFLNLPPVFAAETAPKVNWIVGPKTVNLEGDLAHLNLPKGYLFANAEDTQKLMEYVGNTSSRRDIGLVAPNDQSKDWYVIFSYDPMGYVKDDESQSIDQNAILENIKAGTEEGNKRRKEQGFPAIEVTGWQEAPHYDPVAHNLVWAVAAKESGQALINYNTRKLGRYGVTEINLVTDPQTLPQVKPVLDKIVAGYNYLPGKQYSDFIPNKDKVAEVGLTALIAGGAGAVAVKTGILAKLLLFLGLALKKLWVLVIIGIGALKSLVKGKKPEAVAPKPEPGKPQ
jgi:uncharacterized membrane-anchored protein